MLLTAAEVAERLKVPEARVYSLWKSGHLPVVNIGRHRRCSEDALRDFISAGGFFIKAAGGRSKGDEA